MLATRDPQRNSRAARSLSQWMELRRASRCTGLGIHGERYSADAPNRRAAECERRACGRACRPYLHPTKRGAPRRPDEPEAGSSCLAHERFLSPCLLVAVKPSTRRKRRLLLSLALPRVRVNFQRVVALIPPVSRRAKEELACSHVHARRKLTEWRGHTWQRRTCRLRNDRSCVHAMTIRLRKPAVMRRREHDPAAQRTATEGDASFRLEPTGRSPAVPLAVDRSGHESSRARGCDLVERLRCQCRRSSIKREIVQLLLLGRQRKEIAHILNRSPHTIDGHMKDFYRELGINDRAQLVLLISQLQLADGHSPPPTPGGGESLKTARR